MSEPSGPLVALRGLCKHFPGVVALSDVDLDIAAGTVHALVGENGAGKSTLINVLSGVLRPDAGAFHFRGRPVHLGDAHDARALGIATVHQEADLFPDLTVAENIAWEGGWPRRFGLIDRAALRRTAAEALSIMGSRLSPDAPARALTPAGRQVVGLAAGLARPASLLILDEPTSSLSAAEAETLFARLRLFRDAGGAVLYVSHRMEEIFRLADEVTVLRDGRRVWGGRRSETDPARLVAVMVGRETPAPLAESAVTAGPVRLGCRGLTSADGSFADVTLEARAGEVLGLYGLVGAGRTEWAQAVFGLRTIASGDIHLDGRAWEPAGPGQAARAGLAYLPEDRLRLGICPGLSVRFNAVLAGLRRLSTGPFVSARREDDQARQVVERLAVRLRGLAQPVATLSGGNQQKVVLGRWLACEPGVLILDEPTRGIDVGARSEIHALLRRLARDGRAVVLISSDLPEVLSVSDRVGVFRGGRLVATFAAAEATAEVVAAAALPAAGDGKAVLPSEGRVASPSPWAREAGLLAAILLLAAFLAARTDTFLRADTLADLAENAGLLTLCGLAAALVILAGGIDISFGALMALSAATAGHLMREGWPVPFASLAALTLGAAGGALNAAVALAGRVHPIVVTLGALSVYRGLTVLLIGAKAIHDVPDPFRAPWRTSPLGVPAVAWLALAVVAMAWLLLGRTVVGRQVFALGSNARAAARVGIPPARVGLAVFALQGLLAGLAGLAALGTLGHLQATDFEEKTLEAIGVAVVGGVAITGGRGSVWGVLLAAVLFRLLEKGWVLLQVPSYWQRAIVGGLLLLAILGDRVWRRES